MSWISIRKLLTCLFCLGILGIADAARYSTVGTESECFTRYSTKRPPGGIVSTTTATSITIETTTATQSLTHTTKVTPSPVTTTITKTHTDRTRVTQSTKTKTYFVSSTSTVTTTSLTTITFSASDSTTITQTPTSTLPTAAGFTPLASEPAVINDGGASKKRNVEESKVHPQFPIARLADSKDANHVYDVECFEVVYGIHTTRVTTTTTSTIFLRPKTAKVTTMTEVTSTHTLPHPHATTTVTSSYTSTSTETDTTSTTSTSTTTSTVEAPTATAYAACDPNNQVHMIGNRYVGSSAANQENVDYSSNSALECCNSCQAADDCAGYQWVPFGAPSNQCITFYSGSCDPANTVWYLYAYSEPNGVVQTMGNGPCGQGMIAN